MSSISDNIAHYVSSRKAELTYHGMAAVCALRNTGDVTNRFKTIRDAHGLKQPDIAAALGVSVPQVSRWETGKDNVPSFRLRAFAKAYRTTIEDLFGESDNSDMPVPEGAGGVRKVPLLGVVPGGNWREAVQRSRMTIEVPASHAPRDSYALEIDGDSMDLEVPNGYQIVVDPNDLDLFNNRLYVVMNADGETTFKKFLDNPARLVPCSCNDKHKVIPISGGEFRILGRVTWSGRHHP